MYEMKTFQDGQIHILRTDDEGVFIKFNLDELIADYEIEATASVTPAGEGWYRVEVTIPEECDLDAAENLASDLCTAFSRIGKGWYECKEEGETDDGLRFWYVVRHIGGPWI